MQLSQLSTQGFRNLSSDPVSFRTGVTLITGENAQGKTNLLEAVALVCGQRSFRGASLSEMAADAERFRIAVTVDRAAGSERIALSWSREAGREFFRGEKTAGFPFGPLTSTVTSCAWIAFRVFAPRRVKVYPSTVTEVDVFPSGLGW